MKIWLCGATAHPIETHISYPVDVYYLPVKQRFRVTFSDEVPCQPVRQPCRVYKRVDENRYEFDGYALR